MTRPDTTEASMPYDPSKIDAVRAAADHILLRDPCPECGGDGYHEALTSDYRYPCADCDGAGGWADLKRCDGCDNPRISDECPWCDVERDLFPFALAAWKADLAALRQTCGDVLRHLGAPRDVRTAAAELAVLADQWPKRVEQIDAEMAALDDRWKVNAAAYAERRAAA